MKVVPQQVTEEEKKEDFEPGDLVVFKSGKITMLKGVLFVVRSSKPIDPDDIDLLRLDNGAMYSSMKRGLLIKAKGCFTISN